MILFGVSTLEIVFETIFECIFYFLSLINKEALANFLKHLQRSQLQGLVV